MCVVAHSRTVAGSSVDVCSSRWGWIWEELRSSNEMVFVSCGSSCVCLQVFLCYGDGFIVDKLH